MIDATEINRFEGLARTIVMDYFPPGGWTYDDLMQEARIGIYKGLRDFKAEGGLSLRNFIALCVKRQLFTAIKMATRLKDRNLNEATTVVVHDGEELDALELQAASGTDPFEVLQTRDALADLAHSIRGLTYREQAALAMIVNDRTYEEVAEALECGVKAVDNAMQRARAKLRAANPGLRDLAA